MKPFERLGNARTPDGSLLELFRHDGSYLIRANGIELMSQRRHLSEDRLAEVACVGLKDKPGARVLIGGLGLGFTLRAALIESNNAAAVDLQQHVGALLHQRREPVALERQQPGVIVESVEILADGYARDRRLTRVAIGLRFVVAVAPARDGQRAVPSHGPPTVAPAAGPATPRKVGAFTSHRRPSAFAEPPAPGTAVTSFRPRPSGLQGRRSHTATNNQPKQL